METVEYLMIGKDAALQGMVDESFMQSTIYRLEGNLISPLLKYITQAVGLLHAIRADI